VDRIVGSHHVLGFADRPRNQQASLGRTTHPLHRDTDRTMSEAIGLTREHHFVRRGDDPRSKLTSMDAEI